MTLFFFLSILTATVWVILSPRWPLVDNCWEVARMSLLSCNPKSLQQSVASQMSVLSEKLLSFFSHYKCIQCSPENLSENPHCSKRLKPFPCEFFFFFLNPFFLATSGNSNLLLPTIQTKNSPLSCFPFLSFLPVFFPVVRTLGGFFSF